MDIQTALENWLARLLESEGRAMRADESLSSIDDIEKGDPR